MQRMCMHVRTKFQFLIRDGTGTDRIARGGAGATQVAGTTLRPRLPDARGVRRRR